MYNRTGSAQAKTKSYVVTLGGGKQNTHTKHIKYKMTFLKKRSPLSSFLKKYIYTGNKLRDNSGKESAKIYYFLHINTIVLKKKKKVFSPHFVKWRLYSAGQFRG